MQKNYWFRLVLSIAILAAMSPTLLAQVSFTIQGPGVDPNDFRITEFATGLNFPVGMVELDDGSLLVATNNGNSFYGSFSGSLVRLADADGDGVADSNATLVNNVAGGKLSALRRSGDLVFVTGQGSGVPISIYRLGATAADPLSLEGSITINYSGSWLHPHSALAVRPTPGIAGSHDLFFQLGSRTNFDLTTSTRSLTSDIGSAGTLAGDAIHMIRIADQGGSVSGSNPVQIATGLRNAAGMTFHPVTGDLYFEDNGIDGVVVAIEPTSADEINFIPTAEIGGTIEDFGFPSTYAEYRTNTQVGSQGIDPLVVFQPLPAPDGAEAEGPNDIVFAPAGFPAALRDGLFVGFHGQFSSGGLSNEENPLAFVNLDDGSYFQFISNTEASVGHLDGLLSTSDSLFVADLSPGGGIGSGDRNTGKIYQIQAIAPALPGDFSGDGLVGNADLTLLLDNWGADVPPDPTGWENDLATAPNVGNDDLTRLLDNWGNGAAATTVPEPSALAMALLVSIGGLVGRRVQSVVGVPLSVF